MRRIALGIATTGAIAAFIAPSAAAVSQLFKGGKPASGSACAALVTSSLAFARHYTVAARLYAAPGPAKGLPRLASAEEKQRCGNPERLIERIVPVPAPKRAG
jgi:hypothetical protein